MIKYVDRDKWITISKIAVPLKACTTVATDVVGVSCSDGNHGLGAGTFLKYF